jgi:hypothetical protein
MLVTPVGTVQLCREPLGPVLVALNVTTAGEPVAHTGLQTPETQLVEDVPAVEQVVPHAPQLLTSVWRLRQVPEQLV